MVITIGHHPELTVDHAIELFGRRFGESYKIVRTPRQPLRDFQIEKNSWVGIGVRLKQEPDKTSFVIGGFTPSPWRRVVFAGAFGLLSMLLYNSMTNQVRAFIEQAPEFK